MAIETETHTEDCKDRKPSAEKKTRSTAPIKPSKTAVIADLDKIASIPHCELWTKNVNFDHEKFDVKSHVLLFVHGQPRKYCFNTYNGTLGKRSTDLPLEDFATNTLPSGAKTKPWYSIQDLNKVREKLTKDGYVRHGG